MSRQKEGTARIAMFNELNIPNIFTMEASFCGANIGSLKGQHFTTDNLMTAGRRLLEALIVYTKIDVKININEISDYSKFNAKSLEQELTTNKKLISMTMGEEGNSSGSDSEPSADNLDEEELAEIAPIKIVKKIKIEKIPLKIEVPKKMIVVPEKKPVVVKYIARSPVKRPYGYNPFDRLNLRKLKPDMKDAWTQTSPKSKEQLEQEKREHRQRK